MIKLENELGTLKPGVVADVSVLDDLRWASSASSTTRRPR